MMKKKIPLLLRSELITKLLARALGVRSRILEIIFQHQQWLPQLTIIPPFLQPNTICQLLILFPNSQEVPPPSHPPSPPRSEI